MEATLNIKLKSSILKDLEKKAKELKVDTNAVINNALENYFYLERMNNLRKEVQGKAQALGFISEEDIFLAVS